MIYLTIALLAVLASLLERRPGGRALGWLLPPLATAGLATALWQHFVSSKSTSCALTFADRVVSATTLDEMLPGVRVSSSPSTGNRGSGGTPWGSVGRCSRF